MGFKYLSLNRRADEELLQFDNRISQMFPVVAGTVYFAMENYNPYTGEFGVYIEWDPKLSERLNDKLPSGGYFVKATNGQALDMSSIPYGLPVYMKLISREGRIYPYRTFILWEGRPYGVEFNGNILIPFEKKSEIPENVNPHDRGKMTVGSQRKLLLGSQRFLFGSQRFLLSGSQRKLLLGSQKYLLGSQRYLFGSQRFLTGSNRGIYSLGFGGSQRFLSGSQRYWNHEWEWEYRTGSQRFLFGSQRYLSGSQRFTFGGLWRYLTGSNRGFYSFNFGGRQRYLFGSQRYLFGSQRYLLGSQRFITGSYRPLPYRDIEYIDYTPPITDIPYWHYIPKEWQLINESRRPNCKKGGNGSFGYGLDLI